MFIYPSYSCNSTDVATLESAFLRAAYNSSRIYDDSVIRK